MFANRYHIFDLMGSTMGQFDEVFNSYKSKWDKPAGDGYLKEDGVTTYYKGGKVSRVDGPAVIYDDERPDEYWLDGRQVSKEEVEAKKQELEDNKVHIISIDGISYKITGKELRELKPHLPFKV